MGKWFSGKTLLILFLIIGTGYLASKFPDQAVLIGGIAIIIVIGIWILQANRERFR